MLHLYHSNRMERLLDRLCDVLAGPLDDPFVPEQLVVQSTGLARWVQFRLAERFGIAGNFELHLPASFVWRVLRTCLPEVPEQSAFDKELMTWKILDLLPGFLDRPEAEPLRDYLADDPAGLKTWELARRIADLFDQYLVYRPDWVLGWEAGADGHWQAALWRTLREAVSGPHRAALQRRLLSMDLGPCALPQRVLVFGVSTLAPTSLEVLRHLSDFTEVHLFILNPSTAYWGDIVSERARTRLQTRWRRSGGPDLSDYFETGNPLLASWGRLGRDFQHLLYAGDVPTEEDLFEAPSADSLLGLIQQDLFDLRDRRRDAEKIRIPAGDRSVSVQVCHSPLRELEVLHDRLLDLFQKHPDLHPRDLVVMVPDVDSYAPYVQAVFGSVPEERHIPWSVADLSLGRESRLAGLLIGLLDLPDNRFAASELLGLLEIPELRRRFRLDEGDLPSLHRWVQEAGIRQGRGGAESGGGQDISSWRFGFRRLFLGAALPDGVELFAGNAPVAGVEGGEARTLGALKTLFDRLGEYADQLTEPRSPAQWRSWLNRALDGLLESGDEDPGLDALRAALDRLASGAAQAGLRTPLAREVVKAFLQDELGGRAAQHRYAGGRVTFCAMVPMRAVPFRVVALLGLNDRDFPRRARPLSFDLMAGDRRPGDRSVRDEDRHLFLEALLSTRDCLILSYLGADPRDNAEQQPSLILSELLDYIDAGYAPERPLVVRHPLQPFSPRYRTGDAELYTYAAEWSFSRPVTGAGEAPFSPSPLDEPPDAGGRRPLELQRLEEFLGHPARYFLRRRLGVSLAKDDLGVEDDEPFVLDALERYGLRQGVLDGMLRGRGFDEQVELHRLRGELPHGVFAHLAVAPERTRIEAVVERLGDLAAVPRPRLEVDLDLEGERLQGWLDGVTDQGLLTWRVGAFNGRDLLRLWLRHLVLNALDDPGCPRESRHLDAEGEVRLPALADVAEARGFLVRLAGVYRQGECRPMPLFPRSSYAYCEALAANGDEFGAQLRARRIWDGAEYGDSRGERDDPWLQIAFRGQDPLDGEFASLSEALMGPALSRLVR